MTEGTLEMNERTNGRRRGEAKERKKKEGKEGKEDKSRARALSLSAENSSKAL